MAVPAMTNNSPVAGSIAWDAFTIQYLGVAYSIAAGSTPYRWVWWRYNGGDSVIEAGADIPVDLTDDDVVLFGNKNGTAVRVQSATLVDGELIVDGSILAEALNVNAVTTEHLLAGDALVSGLLQVGETVSQAVSTSGLTIGDQSWNETDGLTIPNVVQFPHNDALSALLWAKVIARELTIENYLKLQGSINEISTGASLAIASGVTPPQNKPTVVDEWEVFQTITLLGGRSVANLRGLVRHPTDATSFFTVYSDAVVTEVLKITNGTQVAQIAIDGFNDGQGGLAYAPTQNRLYILGSASYSYYQGTNSGTPPTGAYMSLTSVDLGLTAYLDETDVSSVSRTYTGDGVQLNDGVQIYPYDNTYFMVAGYTPSQSGMFIGFLFEWAHTRSSAKWAGDSISIDNSGTKFQITGLNYGAFPGNASSPDSSWTIWGKNKDPLIVRVLNGGGTIYAVPRAAGHAVMGSYQDTSVKQFYTLDNAGTIYRYQTGPFSGQLAYSFFDSDTGGTGQHETPLSPPATLLTARGARPKVTGTPPPDTGDADAPDSLRIYYRPGTTGTWYYQGSVVPPAQSYSAPSYPLSQSVAYGAFATFAAAGINPARLFSAAADVLSSIIELKGDGSGRIGPWSWDAVGNPTRSHTKAGTTNSGALTANTPQNVVVTFATPFPASGPVPVVTAIPNITGDPSTVHVSCHTVSRTGFTLRFNRTVATAFDAMWQAMIPTQ